MHKIYLVIKVFWYSAKFYIRTSFYVKLSFTCKLTFYVQEQCFADISAFMGKYFGWGSRQEWPVLIWWAGLAVLSGRYFNIQTLIRLGIAVCNTSWTLSFVVLKCHVTKGHQSWCKEAVTWCGTINYVLPFTVPSNQCSTKEDSAWYSF